jgi:hypothetical protein
MNITGKGSATFFVDSGLGGCHEISKGRRSRGAIALEVGLRRQKPHPVGGDSTALREWVSTKGAAAVVGANICPLALG